MAELPKTNMTHLLVLGLALIVLSQDVLGMDQRIANTRYRRGILGKWWGSDSNALVVPQHQQVVQRVNQQVPHYPIWKVHKYNGINLKPLPVSMVPNYQPLQYTDTLRNVPVAQRQPVIVQERFVPNHNTVKLVDPIVVTEKATTTTLSKTEDDINGIMKLLGISDRSQVPSIQEVMEMLGATTQEEAIETVKDIAATDEGIEMIKSFIESRQTPEEEEEETIIEVITQPPTTTTTTTTTIPPPTTTTTTPIVVLPEKPFHFWSPQQAIAAATAKAASRLDNVHTNAHLMGKILDHHENEPATPSSAFRNTLTNLRKFFTFQDNTPIALEKFNEQEKTKQVTAAAPPTVVYVNEPIPATSINLPPLPKLSPLPAISGVPAMPHMPQIQLPSHFSIPRRVVQGPYMKVKYPVASLAPLPMYRQRPLYTYRGQPIISNAPLSAAAPNGNSRTSLTPSVPLYGAVQQPGKAQIPFSQSTRDAFQNAPQIISSLPVPSLPYTFAEEEGEGDQQEEVNVDDQYIVAANSPIEAVALPAAAIENSENNERRTTEIIAKDEQVEEEEQKGTTGTVAGGPQRLSGYEVYATGKVHRATNLDIVQSLAKASKTSAGGVVEAAAAETSDNNEPERGATGQL